MFRYSDQMVWNKFKGSFPMMSRDTIKFSIESPTRVNVYLKEGNGVLYNYIANRIERRFTWGDHAPVFTDELSFRNHIVLSLRSVMIVKDVNQIELAKTIGITRQQMNRYATGINAIPSYILYKILNALKILFSDLVNL